jgi:hypothetical protein
LAHTTQRGPERSASCRAREHAASGGTDAIDSPAGLRAWLAGRSLAPADLRPTDDDIARMAEFREALRALLHANSGGGGDPADLRSLNRAGRGSLRVRFGEDGGAALEPQPEEPIAAAIGRIVAVVFVAIADGTFIRPRPVRPATAGGRSRPVRTGRPLVQHGDLRSRERCRHRARRVTA